MAEQILIDAKNGNKSLCMTVNPSNAHETILAMNALGSLYSEPRVPQLPQNNGNFDGGLALQLLLAYVAFTAASDAANEVHSCGNTDKCADKMQDNANEQWEQWLKRQQTHGGSDTAPLDSFGNSHLWGFRDSHLWEQWNRIRGNAQANGTQPVTFGKEGKSGNIEGDKQSDGD